MKNTKSNSLIKPWTLVLAAVGILTFTPGLSCIKGGSLTVGSGTNGTVIGGTIELNKTVHSASLKAGKPDTNIPPMVFPREILVPAPVVK